MVQVMRHFFNFKGTSFVNQTPAYANCFASSTVSPGQEVIAIDTPKGREADLAIRKIKGVRWTQTHKVWYLPLNRDRCQKITDTVKKIADIDNSRLKQYLEKKKVTATQGQLENSYLGKGP